MKKKIGIIGYNGFIGSYLKKKLKTNYLYNSKNIKNISKTKFDIIYCAAPSSLIWKAKKNPEKDLSNVIKLCKNLINLKTKKFVLISSIEVYSKTSNCNEISLTLNKKKNLWFQ